jgi:hypothetical protein
MTLAMPPPWTTGRVAEVQEIVNNSVDKIDGYFVDKFPHLGTNHGRCLPAPLRNPLPNNGIYEASRARTEPRSTERGTFRLAL